MGALGVKVLDLLTLEAPPSLARRSPWLCLRPITGCWMKTHSVLVSASQFGVSLPGNIRES